MKLAFKIDALRFSLKSNRITSWERPDVNLVQLSFGKLRVLDTKEGKESILIIPDGPNLIEHYYPLVEDLKKHFRVIIFDYPGFGFSTHNGSFDYSYEKSNEMILELLDLLNLSTVNIVFPCANGFYGLAFTQAFPEKVKQLILIQTPALNEMMKWTERTVPSTLQRPIIGQLLMSFVEKKFANAWYNYALPKGIDRKPYQEIAVNGIQQGASFCLCSLTQGLIKHKHKDLSIDPSIPTTLIYGNKDFTHKSTNFESILSYHKKADIVLFENTGHFPDLEQPKRFIKLLREKIN